MKIIWLPLAIDRVTEITEYISKDYATGNFCLKLGELFRKLETTNLEKLLTVITVSYIALRKSIFIFLQFGTANR